MSFSLTSSGITRPTTGTNDHQGHEASALFLILVLTIYLILSWYRSPWLEEHPEAGFNLVSSPHLKPACAIDLGQCEAAAGLSSSPKPSPGIMPLSCPNRTLLAPKCQPILLVSRCLVSRLPTLLPTALQQFSTWLEKGSVTDDDGNVVSNVVEDDAALDHLMAVINSRVIKVGTITMYRCLERKAINASSLHSLCI